MAIVYSKPPLSLPDQLAKLESRGLAIQDRLGALRALSRISYDRLSGYWHWLRDPATGRFRPQATFDEALRLYEFDRRLRLLVLAGIERVEVLARAAVTHVLAHAYGAFGHTKASSFQPNFDLARWLKGLDEETLRAHEAFIQHFQQKNAGFPRVPIWMATEVMSFGSLSHLFKNGMKRADTGQVAAALGVHPTLCAWWLHTLSTVRNVCAHHGRLWNRHLGVRPMLPKDAVWGGIHPARVYGVRRILRHLTLPIDQGAWWTDATALLRETDGNLQMQKSMDLPNDWATRWM